MLSVLHRDKAEQLSTVLPDHVPMPVVDGLAEEGRGPFPSRTWLRTQ